MGGFILYSDNFDNAIESIVDLGKEMTESAIGGIPTSTQDAVVGGVTEVVNQVSEQVDDTSEENK
ncbi:hypothetical protein L2750_07655 [Shewanella submarina]|uniref:Bacteriocin n=1 Tax=Shewanella submarina TaxID=2016376 RepID=A0ABV7GBG7_9GAMM|nr:hypothetical protein [Shewanella submarina]MCL1037026.1 hypothetical protein [Shewanella submarina]